ISANYPNCDGQGYCRNHVPAFDSILPVRYVTSSGGCQEVPDMTYHGILLGDVQTSWNYNMRQSAQADSIVIDLNTAFVPNGLSPLHVPVHVFGLDTLESMDLQFDFANTVIQSATMDTTGTNLNLLTSENIVNNRYYFTSFASQGNGSPFSGTLVGHLIFDVQPNCIDPSDFQNIIGLANGVTTSTSVNGTYCPPLNNEENHEVNIIAIPNPFGNTLKVEATAYHEPIEEIVVFDALGKLIYEIKGLSAQSHLIHTHLWPAGIYFLQVNGQKTIRLAH
ncbi:MAG: T9SS type A sorting domain-containing protein, partial [Bacteroidota bacterium]